MERLSWVATDSYDLAGFRFAVRATDERFLDLTRRYLQGLRISEAEDVPLFSADLGEERTLPGGKVIPGKRTLYYGTLPVYRGRGDLEMLARVIGFVRSIAAERHNEFVRVRAGAVAVSGGAILLPTLAPRGVAGLVASLTKQGAAVLGDDLTRIDPVLHQVHPLPVPLLLDPDELALFPELGRTPQRMRSRGLSEFQRQAMHRQPVSADEVGGGAATEPAPVRWIVFPEFAPGEETRLEAAGGAEILFRFAETRLNLHVWGDRALFLLRDLLEESAVSRLVVGAIPDAAALLLERAPDLVGGIPA